MLREGADYLAGSWDRNRRSVIRQNQIDGMVCSRFSWLKTRLIYGQAIRQLQQTNSQSMPRFGGGNLQDELSGGGGFDCRSWWSDSL